MNIRIADLADSEAITGIINGAFRNAEAFFVLGSRIDRQKVTELMEAGTFLLAEDHGTLIGCVYLEIKADRAYLGLLAVDPGRQKTGLGSKLMIAAEAYCAKAGCSFVDLQIVNVRKELPGFYQRRGYVENGTAPFPLDVVTKLPCHFVKMTKRLTGE